MHYQMETPPAWSIKGRQPCRRKSATPGPGSYRPTTANLRTGPLFKVGSAQRSDFATGHKAVPGPGSYDPASQGTGPHFSVKGKYHPRRLDNGPGPGTYDADLNDLTGKNRPKSARFGTATRSDVVSASMQVPGPGTYACAGTNQSPPEMPINQRVSKPPSGKGRSVRRGVSS